MFDYVECNDANQFFILASENSLHLPRGIMMRTIRSAADEPDYSFKGVLVYANGKCCALGCITRKKPEAAYSLMLYVKTWLRGMGIGYELVRQLIKAAEGRRVFCFPWDSRSVIFYRKCVDKEIVTLDNFQAYERRLVSDESLQWTLGSGDNNGNRKGVEVQRI
ncbi:acyl-CoA N-acyltransferase superfamily protein [Serratia phage Moabite]|uniref:Acyl-CoA N-acyltransferase superfamily protein n=3 Tax=Moabitevirus TaxID=2843422 RepID=A0A4Y5TR91_9CAUD|nr:hypothetical protein HWB23_gp333 [Serratia phage vB_SmaM_ 2050HW]YP_009849154.1 acyl-CoA N-acyltransferase superfamily protein [Serratia phage Moabite]QPX76759.1 putative GNAT family N-acetyltransferase protein [Serratia phage vB_SmaM_Yaphecito]UGO54274.1 hypothetical protein HAYMO_292 [Serratia phage vB_SmaM_Haymo]ATA65668.1 hypothetical protein 2050HW_00333 [Serratia phage vB_SmaM_ 2050HW]QDB71090.1 acyl-CoA N-acyltransferase superfamily protein [Serratia phage Moabite]